MAFGGGGVIFKTIYGKGEIMKILVLATLLLFTIGCTSSNVKFKPENQPVNVQYRNIAKIAEINGAIFLCEIDGCQYIFYDSGGSAVIHKANCPNLIHKGNQ